MKHKQLGVWVAACMIAGGASAPSADLDSVEKADSGGKRMLVTYINLTSGQVFSPIVLFSHNAAAVPLFVEGLPASFGLQRLAEEGNSGPLLSSAIRPSLGGAYGDATVGISLLPYKSRKVSLTVTAQHPLISAAFMLMRTNDGFGAIKDVNAYELTDPLTLDVFGWDAGTENNNENGDALIAMEGTARDPENGAVRKHEGLRGDADAPPSWKFNPAKPVGRIVIAPVR